MHRFVNLLTAVPVRLPIFMLRFVNLLTATIVRPRNFLTAIAHTTFIRFFVSHRHSRSWLWLCHNRMSFFGFLRIFLFATSLVLLDSVPALGRRLTLVRCMLSGTQDSR